jgi:hypothetical protein
VVYAALAGNIAIAVAKLIAFAVSKSSAMLAEAIHSFVDSVDQILLLVGESRGRRPPDADHPLGHGMESYFWGLPLDHGECVVPFGVAAPVQEDLRPGCRGTLCDQSPDAVCRAGNQHSGLGQVHIVCHRFLVAVFCRAARR